MSRIVFDGNSWIERISKTKKKKIIRHQRHCFRSGKSERDDWMARAAVFPRRVRRRENGSYFARGFRCALVVRRALFWRAFRVSRETPSVVCRSPGSAARPSRPVWQTTTGDGGVYPRGTPCYAWRRRAERFAVIAGSGRVARRTRLTPTSPPSNAPGPRRRVARNLNYCTKTKGSAAVAYEYYRVGSRCFRRKTQCETVFFFFFSSFLFCFPSDAKRRSGGARAEEWMWVVGRTSDGGRRAKVVDCRNRAPRADLMVRKIK